jgi:purine-binding chemotaxis protein CheW
VTGLSFTVDGCLFAVDADLVQKMARKFAVTPVPAAPRAVMGIANLKGKVVTVFDLYELLGQRRTNSGGLINVIIFKPFTAEGENQMGLAIDKTGDLVEISESRIRQPASGAELDDSGCIRGVAEVGGVLYRIIDIKAAAKKYGGITL